MYNQTLFSSSDDEMDDLYNKLHESLLKASKDLKHADNRNESLID